MKRKEFLSNFGGQYYFNYEHSNYAKHHTEEYNKAKKSYKKDMAIVITAINNANSCDVKLIKIEKEDVFNYHAVCKIEENFIVNIFSKDLDCNLANYNNVDKEIGNVPQEKREDLIKWLVHENDMRIAEMKRLSEISERELESIDEEFLKLIEVAKIK